MAPQANEQYTTIALAELKWLKEAVGGIGHTVEGLRSEIVELRILLAKSEQYESRITRLETECAAMRLKLVEHEGYDRRVKGLEEFRDSTDKELSWIKAKVILVVAGASIFLKFALDWLGAKILPK